MNNIDFHINNLIDEIPQRSNPERTDVILEGGLFNGSYLLGALYYLKGLEQRNIIKINRLSGCSIGSVVALIYYSNAFDLVDIIYKITYNHFKKKYNVDIFSKIFSKIRPYITKEVFKKLNGNLYITFFDIKENIQIVKNTYKNIDDLFETIHKSCYCPYVVDNSFVYKKKYVDGFYPYLFPVTSSNKKVLYLNIHNFDKLANCISIKNEKTNYTRIFAGILDIHSFFKYKTPTSICSYVNDWSLLDIITNYIFIQIVKIIPYLLHKIYLLNKVILKSNIDVSLTMYNQIVKACYIYFIKSYCI